MLLEKYLRKYIIAQGELTILGLGKFILVQEDLDSYRVTFQHEANVPTDLHFIETVSQLESMDFEATQNQLNDDSVYIKNLLNDDTLVQLGGLGSLKFINNQLTFFSEKL